MIAERTVPATADEVAAAKVLTDNAAVVAGRIATHGTVPAAALAKDYEAAIHMLSARIARLEDRLAFDSRQTSNPFQTGDCPYRDENIEPHPTLKT